MAEICKLREVCDAQCELLGALAATGANVDMVVNAARKGAALPYSSCEAGPLTSKPGRFGPTWEYCGQRHEVQIGMQTVIALHAAETALAIHE